MRILVPTGFLAGFWLAAIYGPRAADRVSNGIYPPALLGALLELVFGFWLLGVIHHWYGGTITKHNRGWLALGSLALVAGSLLWYLSMIQNHVAHMPPKLGSYYGLYFVAPPLWILLLAARCLITTVSSYLK